MLLVLKKFDHKKKSLKLGHKKMCAGKSKFVACIISLTHADNIWKSSSVILSLVPQKCNKKLSKIAEKKLNAQKISSKLNQWKKTSGNCILKKII